MTSEQMKAIARATDGIDMVVVNSLIGTNQGCMCSLLNTR